MDIDNKKSKKRRRKNIKYRLVIKTILFMIFVIFMNATKAAVEPIMTNMLAIGQLQSDNYSYAIYTYYMYFKNYGWLLYLLILVILYGKEIMNLIDYVIKTEKGE